jgi:hypothetical protein
MKDMSAMNASIEIKVSNLEWKGKLQDVVHIDMKEFDAELANQASIVSWFGTVLAEAIALYEELKDRKERVYAQLYLEHKEKKEGEDKKLTEKLLDSLILTDPRYDAIQKDFNSIRRQVNLLKSLSISLEHRRDMLIQLSANIRKELMAGDYGFEPQQQGKDAVDLKKVKDHNG